MRSRHRELAGAARGQERVEMRGRHAAGGMAGESVATGDRNGMSRFRPHLSTPSSQSNQTSG